MQNFAAICEADEVVLFERATFLVIASSTRVKQMDSHRFEKVSNIIKQFKLSCSRMRAQFLSMEVGNKEYTAFVESFTVNTYIMVIQSDRAIPPAATHMNIQVARNHFERIIKEEEKES